MWSFAPAGTRFGERGLDVHVNVFEFGLPLEFAGGDFLPDLIQAADDRAWHSALVSTPIFCEHRGVGHGAEDVVPPEPPVEGDGFGECGDVGARAAG